jgi:hypothetical protein
MSFSAPVQIPPFCVHKPTGQAYVNLGGRRRYLGRHDSPEASHAYHRILAEWSTHGGRMPVKPEQVTINELLARFWEHAEVYYRRSDGSFTSEIENYRQAMKPLREISSEIAHIPGSASSGSLRDCTRIDSIPSSSVVESSASRAKAIRR